MGKSYLIKYSEYSYYPRFSRRPARAHVIEPRSLCADIHKRDPHNRLRPMCVSHLRILVGVIIGSEGKLIARFQGSEIFTRSHVGDVRIRRVIFSIHAGHDDIRRDRPITRTSVAVQGLAHTYLLLVVEDLDVRAAIVKVAQGKQETAVDRRGPVW